MITELFVFTELYTIKKKQSGSLEKVRSSDCLVTRSFVDVSGKLLCASAR